MDTIIRTPRVEKLRSRMVTTPQICIERAYYMTESYLETEHLPPVLRRAKAFENVFSKMPIRIEESELIAGWPTSKIRGGALQAETHSIWILNELDTVQDRDWERYAPLTDDEKRRIVDYIMPYWKGKTLYEKWAGEVPEDYVKLENVLQSAGGYVRNGHHHAHVAANYLATPDEERALTPIEKKGSCPHPSVDASSPLKPPFLTLIASGGHSHIVKVNTFTDYEVLARTRDDAAGEAMDKVARALCLPYPGGLHMDRTAAQGDRKAFTFTRPRLAAPSLDFSFSGLKTAALNILNSAKQKGEQVDTQDFCASFREAVCAYLTEHTLLSARETGLKKIVLAGGVCANTRLREMMSGACAAQAFELYLPATELCGDNAAMVGAQGYYELLAGHTAGLDFNANAALDIRAIS